MTKIINILYLDDDPIDIKLTEAVLKKSRLFEFILTTVNTKDKFEKAVIDNNFDIIISDYSMPNYNGQKALEFIKSNDQITPFILVSGAVGDEVAVDIMKTGAVDYVLKDKLEKLPFVILKALELTDAHEDKARWESMFHLIESASSACFFRLNEAGHFTYVNKKLCGLIGIPEKVAHKSSWYQYVSSDMKEEITKKWKEISKPDDKLDVVCKIEHKDGSSSWVSLLIIPEEIINGKIEKYVGMFFDITHIKETETKLQELENFDSLTGLINRKMFEVILDETIANGRQYNKKFSVLFCDIGGIKKINDTLGHSSGDQLLIHAAEVLRRSCEIEDVIARFEGNIFTLIINHGKNRSRVLQEINKIINNFKESSAIAEQEVYCKINIGVASFPDSGMTRSSLLIHADQALYKAIASDRASYAFYSNKISEEINKLSTIEQSLRYAIENNEIYLCYQPQIDISSNKIIGLEALCRWENKELGFVSPADFIPIAESAELINPLTNYICKQAFLQCSEWLTQYPHLFDDTEISINLSAASLSDEIFIDSVLNMYSRYKINPKRICFEVTETAIMNNMDSAFRVLSKMSDIGFNIAIDDFGTGYSSLAYLKSLPATILKIDSSFVLDIHEDNNDLIIVTAIINLAKSLDLYTIAEGTENVQQLEILENLNVNAIQGYYFSKPMLPNDVIPFFKNWGKSELKDKPHE